MPNPYFEFKRFTVHHDRCAMKVTTDACLFGAWCAKEFRKDKAKTGLDIGTGTGLLSLLVAQQNNIEIDAIEIDQDAATQAKENIASSPWKEKVKIIEADALSYKYKIQYDVIFSNPPFYENELESPNESRNTAHHGRGLKMQELISILRKDLSATGNFYLLLPFKRILEMEQLLEKHHLFFNEKIIVAPSPSHRPSRVMIKGCSKVTNTIQKQMFIRAHDSGYSPEFIELLQPYYLHL